MMDKTVAAASGMAAAFYFMAAAFAWFRVASPSPSLSTVRKVILDRAVAWSALSALFAMVVAVKLSVARWTDPGVDIVLFLASLAIFIAGLVSVRAITAAMFGNKVLLGFGAVSIAVGALILLF